MKPRSHHYSGGEIRFSPRPDDSIPVPLTRNYADRRYSTNTNRHWWGIAHRARLIREGRYIKTSQQQARSLFALIPPEVDRVEITNTHRNQMPGTPRGSWNEIHWIKQTQRDTKDDD